jgi:hypothetical protein
MSPSNKGANHDGDKETAAAARAGELLRALEKRQLMSTFFGMSFFC